MRKIVKLFNKAVLGLVLIISLQSDAQESLPIENKEFQIKLLSSKKSKPKRKLTQRLLKKPVHREVASNKKTVKSSKSESPKEASKPHQNP
jgi:hypothetical protein